MTQHVICVVWNQFLSEMRKCIEGLNMEVYKRSPQGWKSNHFRFLIWITLNLTFSFNTEAVTLFWFVWTPLLHQPLQVIFSFNILFVNFRSPVDGMFRLKQIILWSTSLVNSSYFLVKKRNCSLFNRPNTPGFPLVWCHTKQTMKCPWICLDKGFKISNYTLVDPLCVPYFVLMQICFASCYQSSRVCCIKYWVRSW